MDFEEWISKQNQDWDSIYRSTYAFEHVREAFKAGQASARAELEAKLAKAREALEYYATFDDGYHSDTAHEAIEALKEINL